MANLTFQTNAFAYDYYSDNGMNYSDEQFKRDMKSYLDEQMTRQENQELLDRIRSKGNGHTDTDIQILQEKFNQQQKDNQMTLDQMKQMVDSVNADTAKLLQEKETYQNTRTFCLSLAEKYALSGATSDLVTNCRKYNVEIPLEKKVTTVARKESVKEEPREQTLDEILASPSSSTTPIAQEVSQKQSFFKRAVSHIKGWFSWLR